MQTIYSCLLFFVFLIPSSNLIFAQNKVRWLYSFPPKHFKELFEDKKFSGFLSKVKQGAFINKDGLVQIDPELKDKLHKRLNFLLKNMNELEYDYKRTKFLVFPTKKTHAIKGHLLEGLVFKQGNRMFCLPCAMKGKGEKVFGELSRKDVFLADEADKPALIHIKSKSIKGTKKKVFKSKSDEIEVKVMKGEYQINSMRTEEGSNYHRMNCYYQLRLHYKGKRLAYLPQVSFLNEKAPTFVSKVSPKEVILFFDDRIQLYPFKSKLVPDKLAEYVLTLPSDDFMKVNFWYAPGMKYAPTFTFVKKENLIDLGEGKKVKTSSKLLKIWDDEIKNLFALYRNDAYYNAKDEYCKIIQTCFQVDKNMQGPLHKTFQKSHKVDCLKK